jgi:hypothetical protein
MAGRGGIFHYVAHGDRAEWEALGWVHEHDLGPPHNAYSSLYRWAGKGPAKLPYLNDERERQLADFDAVFGTGGDGE